MHIERFLHKMLSSVIHLKRLETLTLLVLSGLREKKISLTHLGRGIALPIQERSGIRRSDRFLGNKHVHEERQMIYKKCVDKMIGKKMRPRIIVDWSSIPNTTNHMLRAALVGIGRSLTLYEEVHKEKKLGNGKVEANFLKSLKKILPDGCQPIIVTDAGFRNPWFKQIVCLGWDYVGRVRGTHQYFDGLSWKACTELWKTASPILRSIGKIVLCKGNPLTAYLYVIKELSKGRKALTKQGKKKQNKDSIAYGRSAKEPWVLASSLSRANQVYRIYKTRMQIEESFRDLKSSYYGFSFEKAHSRDLKRIEVLLLIAMLASFFAWLVGWIAEKKNWQYQYQVNSLKQKRVLSLFTLGCRVIKRKEPILLNELEYAINKAFR